MDQEIDRLRDRMHEMAGLINAAMTRTEVTASKQEGIGGQLDRIEAAVGLLTTKVTVLETRSDDARAVGRNWGIGAGVVGTAVYSALAYFFGSK